jgi:hypothetical protein
VTGMRTHRRFERCDPITVRAAARVLRLGRSGVILPGDMLFYIRMLASFENGGRPVSEVALGALAERRSVLARTGAPARFGLTRRPCRPALPGGRAVGCPQRRQAAAVKGNRLR